MTDFVPDEDPKALIHAMERIVADLRNTLHETADVRRQAKEALRTTRIELARLKYLNAASVIGPRPS